MSNARRAYFYLVSLVTLGILAAGVRGLLALFFDLLVTRPVLSGRTGFTLQQLSLNLAMIVIGGPLWFFFWRSIQNTVSGKTAEIGASLRKIYLNLILTVSTLVALYAASNLFQWLLTFTDRPPGGLGSLATLIVVFAIWYYHWKVSDTEGHPSPAAQTLRRWYVYIVSGWGLVSLAIGFIELIYVLTLLLPIWGTTLTGQAFWSSSVRSSLAWTLLGGLWWYFHWFHLARGDSSSTLRQVYIYLLAILVSAIAGLVALIVTLYRLIVWLLGAASGANYFQFLGWAIPTIVVSAAIWTYHRFLSREEAEQEARSLSSQRIQLYIMSFLGLGTGAAGAILLLGILWGLLINAIYAPLVIEPGWWQRQLSLCLAFLIVGFPIWWYYWGDIISITIARGAIERPSGPRRIYLYLILGVAIIALAADLVNIVYQFLNWILTRPSGLIVLRNAGWSIQSAVVAIPVLIYHWRVVRQDQHQGLTGISKNVILLADIDPAGLVQQLEMKLGTKIKVLKSAGSPAPSTILSEQDISQIITEVEASTTPNIQIIIHQGQILVLPYL